MKVADGPMMSVIVHQCCQGACFSIIQNLEFLMSHLVLVGGSTADTTEVNEILVHMAHQSMHFSGDIYLKNV